MDDSFQTKRTQTPQQDSSQTPVRNDMFLALVSLLKIGEDTARLQDQPFLGAQYCSVMLGP